MASNWLAAIVALEDVPLPSVPTRDAICSVRMSFQGLTFDTPSYGKVFWWETIAWWPEMADRQAAYAAKHAAEDTHIIVDLAGSYKELGPAYDQIGADYSQDLPGLVVRVKEAIDNGFLVVLPLAGDGQGAGPGYNDPVGSTYGHDWLMANFPRIAEALRPVYKYILFIPGYDGVFYGWTPEQVVAFGQLFRSIFPDGHLGLEFNTGHIPLGEGGADYLPGGRMQDYDVILGEFDPGNYHNNTTWGIVGRLISPYHRPADDTPANNGNDRDPRPFLLGTPNPRGPWYFVAFEIITYFWSRGFSPPTEPAAYRQYFRDMGCPWVC